MKTMFGWFLLLVYSAFGLLLIGSIFLTQRVIRLALAQEKKRANSPRNISARNPI